jgi:hypothetical protein
MKNTPRQKDSSVARTRQLTMIGMRIKVRIWLIEPPTIVPQVGIESITTVYRNLIA